MGIWDPSLLCGRGHRMGSGKLMVFDPEYSTSGKAKYCDKGARVTIESAVSRRLRKAGGRAQPSVKARA